MPAKSDGGSLPVYRFYNTGTGTHFFTISEQEKNTLLQQASQWRFEGPAFYAYTRKVLGSVPVYRLYNTKKGTHFWTASEGERSSLLQTQPDFKDEGIAFYTIQ